MKRIAASLDGQSFGRLTVQCREGSDKFGKAAWRCTCVCGKEIVVATGALRSGNTTSCGCTRTIHGHCVNARSDSPSPTYSSWHAMIKRCREPLNDEYWRYGGAGVIVCDRWSTFANFLADAGERPSGTTIDRWPNRTGNYEPGNVRWATPHEQNLNRSITKLTEAMVQEIWGRHEHGEPLSSIAPRLGVAASYLSAIIHEKKWRGSRHGYGGCSQSANNREAAP